LKDLVKVLEESLGLCPIGFLDIFTVDLNDGWESVNDELF
jgi:hypothetical protein